MGDPIFLISGLLQHLLRKSVTDLNLILFYDLFLGEIKKSARSPLNLK